jgi:hypothetical protein
MEQSNQQPWPLDDLSLIDKMWLIIGLAENLSDMRKCQCHSAPSYSPSSPDPVNDGLVNNGTKPKDLPGSRILFRSTIRVPGIEKRERYLVTSLRAVQIIPDGVGSEVEVLHTESFYQWCAFGYFYNAYFPRALK